MKASAIRIDVQEISKVERAVPPMAVVTASIKFSLQGDLSALESEGLSPQMQKAILSKKLQEALQNIRLG